MAWSSARAGGWDKKGRKRARGPSLGEETPKEGTRFMGSDSEKCLDNIAVISAFLREPLDRQAHHGRGNRQSEPCRKKGAASVLAAPSWKGTPA
jgi:hypothetical protein